MACPQNGTVVLKGLTNYGVTPRGGLSSPYGTVWYDTRLASLSREGSSSIVCTVISSATPLIPMRIPISIPDNVTNSNIDTDIDTDIDNDNITNSEIDVGVYR